MGPGPCRAYRRLMQPTPYGAPPRLVRPRQGRLIAGVCAGLARRFGWSPTGVRLVFLLSCLLPGPQIVVYLLLWVLVLAGALAVSAIFVGEMVVGWYAEDGADVVAVTNLLETLFSGAIAAAVVPVGLAFFVGVMVFALPVVRDGGAHRWPAIVFAVGSLLILAEIISGEVLLSQVGNALMFVGSAWFAWLLFRGEWPGRQAAGGDDRR